MLNRTSFLLLATAALAAQATADITITYRSSPTGPPTEVITGEYSASFDRDLDASTGGFLPDIQGFARAHGSYGTVRSHSRLRATGASAFAGAFGGYAQVRTEFSDEVLVTSNTMTGTGTGTWLFAVHGSAFADVSNLPAFTNVSSSARTSVHINGIGIDEADSSANNLNGGSGFDGFNRIVELQFTFTIGEPFELRGMVETTAQFMNDTTLGMPWTAEADANFSRTFQWVGVGDLFDANGDLLTDYSMTSASGTDWTIPAPASLGVFGAGLIAIVRRRR